MSPLPLIAPRAFAKMTLVSSHDDSLLLSFVLLFHFVKLIFVQLFHFQSLSRSATGLVAVNEVWGSGLLINLIQR